MTRPAGRDFRTIVNVTGDDRTDLSAGGGVGAGGAGARLRAPPDSVALFLYGLLPIIENSIAGIEGVPAAVRDAARGMGLSRWQMLRDVELPLAMPVILAGVRVSVTIGIGTATIGSRSAR